MFTHNARIKNLFWADAISRAAYEKFSDVVTFDATYLTNKYDMPFAPIMVTMDNQFYLDVDYYQVKILLCLFGCFVLGKHAWLAEHQVS